MNTKYFSVNTIAGGKFFEAYSPVPENLIFPALRRHEVKGPLEPNGLQRAIQRELDAQNELPPDVKAMVEEESARLQENPVAKAKIVEKGPHYDAYLPADLEAELAAEPPPMVWNPPVAEDGPEEPDPYAGKNLKRQRQEWSPAPKLAGTHVRRGVRFTPIGELEKLRPGEFLYQRRGQAFVKTGRVKKEEI